MRIDSRIASPIADRDHRCAILELAFAMCAVDGHLADEELAAFRDLVGILQGRPATDDDVGELLERFVEKAQMLGVEERVARLALNVPPPLRETAFRVTFALSLVDGEESAFERELVAELAGHLAMSAEQAAALEASVRALSA
jgi:tellurite resistance protein